MRQDGSCWLTSIVARARVDPTGVNACLENVDAVVSDELAVLDYSSICQRNVKRITGGEE